LEYFVGVFELLGSIFTLKVFILLSFEVCLNVESNDFLSFLSGVFELFLENFPLSNFMLFNFTDFFKISEFSLFLELFLFNFSFALTLLLLNFDFSDNSFFFEKGISFFLIWFLYSTSSLITKKVFSGFFGFTYSEFSGQLVFNLLVFFLIFRLFLIIFK